MVVDEDKESDGTDTPAVSEEPDESAVVTDEDIRAALRAIRSGDEPLLGKIADLVVASTQRPASPDAEPLAPQPLVDAVLGAWSAERDIANGGLDQYVWNHGVDESRRVAASFREVGALENADVIDMLADELERCRSEIGPDPISSDPVRHFLTFRRRGGGPFFAIPDLDDEIGEAIVEYVIAHAAEFPDPDGPLLRVATAASPQPQ